VILHEMVFDRPDAVESEAFGELDMLQRLAEQPVDAAFLPWRGQLELVEQAEFHGVRSRIRRMSPPDIARG